eukprot:30447-Pelagococcus_subviridis.AAC.5
MSGETAGSRVTFEASIAATSSSMRFAASGVTDFPRSVFAQRRRRSDLRSSSARLVTSDEEEEEEEEVEEATCRLERHPPREASLARDDAALAAALAGLSSDANADERAPMRVDARIAASAAARPAS